MLPTGTSTAFITEVLLFIAGEPPHTPHAKLRYSTASTASGVLRTSKQSNINVWMVLHSFSILVLSLIFCLWGMSEMHTLHKKHIHMWMCSSANVPMTMSMKRSEINQNCTSFTCITVTPPTDGVCSVPVCHPFKDKTDVKHTRVLRLTCGNAALLQDWCLH